MSEQEMSKNKIVTFEIKPCPFCGHNADVGLSDQGGIKMECQNMDCGASLPEWTPFDKSDDPTVLEKIEMAIKYWNNRKIVNE
jgi:hypothetical protein